MQDTDIKNKIIARLVAEDARDLSDAELERCLDPCVAAWLTKIAKRLRDTDVLTLRELQLETFKRKCADLGLCPACLNAGESNDHSLDMFGDCTNCGHHETCIAGSSF